MVPSLRTAASMSVTWARPWVVATMCSIRVSDHLTGIRWTRAITARTASSGYRPNFTPKPPPTSGATTRIWFWGRPRATARSRRRTWGAWVVAQTWMPPVTGSGAARHARASRGIPARRWLTMRCRTIRSARGKAASGSPALMVFVCSTFPGASSKSWGAPAASAAKTSVTAGSGSHSTWTSPAASTATASEVATTAATASPTARTRSVDRA